MTASLQAGRVFGGTPSYVFRRVTLPMISRGIFAGWMMIFIIAFRETCDGEPHRAAEYLGRFNVY